MRKGMEVIEEAMRLVKNCWFTSTQNIFEKGQLVNVFLTTEDDKSSFRITSRRGFRYGVGLNNIGYTEYGRYSRTQAVIMFDVKDKHTVVDWREIEVVVSMDCGPEVCRIVLDDYGRGTSGIIKADIRHTISLSVPRQ